jgi:hypothetical protein
MDVSNFSNILKAATIPHVLKINKLEMRYLDVYPQQRPASNIIAKVTQNGSYADYSNLSAV